MISFFRKIRQNLLNEGKTARYFKYAIGEILLVVIGIIIALQLNNWNEQRKLEIEEFKLLRNLQLEIQNDLALIENSKQIHSTTPAAIDRIMNHLENDLPYEDDLKYDFHKTTRLWGPTINASVYQTLKSKGFDLISNDGLSQDIISYYSYMENNYDRNINLYVGFVSEANSSIISYRFEALWLADYDTYRKTQAYDDLQAYMIPRDYEALKSDHEYHFYLSSIKSQNYWFIDRAMSIAIDMATQLNSDIEAELQRRTSSQ